MSILSRSEIEERLELLSVAGGPMEGFWAWEALETARQLAEWLEALLSKDVSFTSEYDVQLAALNKRDEAETTAGAWLGGAE